MVLTSALLLMSVCFQSHPEVLLLLLLLLLVASTEAVSGRA
jgi:hypothetical protein